MLEFIFGPQLTVRVAHFYACLRIKVKEAHIESGHAIGAYVIQSVCDHRLREAGESVAQWVAVEFSLV